MPTQRDVASHIDLSLTRVAELEKRGVIDRAQPLDRIRVAYIRHLRALKSGVTDERARKDKADAELKEFELAKRRGEHVPATDQDHVVIALASVITSRIRAVSSRTAPELALESDRARCQEIVEAAIDEALLDLVAAGDRAAARKAALGSPSVH